MAQLSTHIVTVVQARTGSSRLPNKTMMALCGKTLLERMVERVQAARLSGTVVVATTTDPADDPLADLCAEAGLRVFRGHPTDLLDRHYRAGLAYGATVVVKIPSDCPLIDPAVIDRVIGHYLDNADHLDFVSNLHPATYPDGNDVEVMPMHLLALAHAEANKPYEREHTTPFFWEQPDRFRLGNVTWETGLNFSMSHRFNIDYKEDYDFIRTVYDELHTSRRHFTLDDILQLLETRPDIAAINSRYAGVNWYRNHLDELRTVTSAETRQVPTGR